MGTLHDVLFVGTSHGRLLKISSNSNTLIEAIQVFPYHVPVRNILVSDSDQIIILSDHEVSLFRAIFDLSKKIALSILLLKLGVSVKKSKFMKKQKFKKCGKNDMI